jgi:hypothetical protein
MTKIENNIAIEDIHSNIPKTFEFIDNNLPDRYSRRVLELLPDDKKVDLAYIRQVRTERIKNAPIVTALFRVAQQNKALKEKSKKN